MTSGGSLTVEDDLTVGTAGLLAVDEAENTFGNAISFVSGGELNVAGTLTLQAGENALNIGSGAVTADQLAFSSETDGSSLTVSDGSFTSLGDISGNLDSLIFAGGSSLALGSDEDESTSTGTVSLDLEFSGGGLAVYGKDWTMEGDLSLSDGGSASIYASNFEAAGSVQVDGPGSNLTVESNASANFAKLEIAGGGTLTIAGTATVTGSHFDDDDFGLSFDDESVIVSGGTLTIAGAALEGLYANGGSEEDAVINQDYGKVTVTGGGSLTLAYGSDSTFSLAQLNALKEALVANLDDSGLLQDGNFSLGDVAISDLELIIHGGPDGGHGDQNFEEDDPKGEYYWADWTDLKYVLDSIADSEIAGLSETRIEKIKAADAVAGNYGALEAVSGTASITIGNETYKGSYTLGNAASNEGFFASSLEEDEDGNVKRQAAGLSLSSGVTLTLKNGGMAGSIVLAQGSPSQGETAADVTTLIINNASGSGTALDSVTYKGFDAGSFSSAELISSQTALITKNGPTLIEGDIAVADYQVGGADTAAGNVYAGSLSVTSSGSLSIKKSADETGGNLELYGQALIEGSVEAEGALTLSSDAVLLDAGELRTGSINAGGSAILVGWEALDEDESTALNLHESFDAGQSYTGFLKTDCLSLGGGYLIVDPVYGQGASVALIGYFGTVGDDDGTAGTIDGTILVGQNSIAGLGTADEEALKEAVVEYLDDKGSLSPDYAGSIVYIAKNLVIEDGYGIISTSDGLQEFISRVQQDTYSELPIELDADNGNLPSIKNAFFLGDNTLTMIDASVMEDGQAAISFNATDAQVIAAGGEIYIKGSVTSGQTYNIFTDGDGAVSIIDVDGKETDEDNGITVRTGNGLLSGTLHGETGGSVMLGLSQNWRGILSGASDSASSAIADYAQGSIEGSNPLLEASVNQGNGSAAESAPRLAVYGGAVQAALSAGASSYEAIEARLGMGRPGAALTHADTNGGSIWLAPVYKHHESDKFNAQGVNYGTDIDLYGLALGVDYSFLQGFTAGVMFNLGTGDSDGKGAGSSANNDFDYWGIGLYAAYEIDNFKVMADLTYTEVDNDLEAGSDLPSIGRLEASTDSTARTFGLTAQYRFETDAVDITPHLGLRYISIDVDDYTVRSAAGHVAKIGSDSMDVFQIPVGVTFSKSFAADDWSISPALDIFAVASLGDDDLDGEVHWTGTNSKTALLTKVMDDWYYGMGAGLDAKYRGLTLGVSLNYAGSSHTDELGLQARVSFSF